MGKLYTEYSFLESTLNGNLLKAPRGLALEKPIDHLTDIPAFLLFVSKSFLGTPYAFCRNQEACFWKCCNRGWKGQDAVTVSACGQGGGGRGFETFYLFAKYVHSCFGEELGEGNALSRTPVSFLFIACFWLHMKCSQRRT